jgi:hypothetical protein
MAKITRINPDTMSKPLANYSHVVTAEGAQKLVFCAGRDLALIFGALRTWLLPGCYHFWPRSSEHQRVIPVSLSQDFLHNGRRAIVGAAN